MIDSVLESKYQTMVLGFFLVCPPRSFGTRELSGRLRISPGRLSAALSSLVKFGYLKSFAKRGLVYYIANPGKQLLPQIKRSLMSKQRPYGDELIAGVKTLGAVKAAYLSGIFAGQPHLPVDLLLVGKVNLKKLDQFLRRCHSIFGQEINYSIMNEAEFILRRGTFDRFIKDIFDYPHITVVEKFHSKKTNK